MTDGSEAPTRPALRWHGGKWRLAPWVIAHFPPHRIYVEPFGGAASVLLRKPRAYGEIWNDLDDDVVNLFQVLRGPRAAELIEAVRLTAFARAEFRLAYEPIAEPVERARRLVTRASQGFGSNAHNIGINTGFRSDSHRPGTLPATDWLGMPAALAAVARRFEGVIIEHRPAQAVMAQHDGPATLHYVDPPYLHATRTSRLAGRNDYRGYQHEMDDAQHAELLQFVRGLEGMVLISGYPHPLYDQGLPGWRRVERAAYTHGGRRRVEALWLSPAAATALGDAQAQGELLHA